MNTKFKKNPIENNFPNKINSIIFFEYSINLRNTWRKKGWHVLTGVIVFTLENVTSQLLPFSFKKRYTDILPTKLQKINALNKKIKLIGIKKREIKKGVKFKNGNWEWTQWNEVP